MHYLPSILITGGDGQIASALCQHPLAKNFTLTASSHESLDITSRACIDAAIKQCRPDYIINTAAYTAVDKAEANAEICMRVNHLGAHTLASACKAHRIPLLHLSTDYIFSGDKTSPYLEDDAANPVNLYGKSKWLGEQAIRELCEDHLILRVSGVFSEYGHNFLKTILKLAQEKKQLTIVADQITCPTYAGDIAETIFNMITQKSRYGTYHFCNHPPVSWYDFASAIIMQAAAHYDLQVAEVKAVRTTDYLTAAKRPAYSVLDCNKIEKEFGIAPHAWETAIEKIITNPL